MRLVRVCYLAGGGMNILSEGEKGDSARGFLKLKLHRRTVGGVLLIGAQSTLGW